MGNSEGCNTPLKGTTSPEAREIARLRLALSEVARWTNARQGTVHQIAMAGLDGKSEDEIRRLGRTNPILSS